MYFLHSHFTLIFKILILNVIYCDLNWQYKIKIGELLLVREIKKVVTLKYMIQNNSVSTIESVIQDSNLSESSNLEAIIADTAQLIDSFAEFSENKEKAKQKKK